MRNPDNVRVLERQGRGPLVIGVGVAALEPDLALVGAAQVVRLAAWLSPAGAMAAPGRAPDVLGTPGGTIRVRAELALELRPPVVAKLGGRPALAPGRHRDVHSERNGQHHEHGQQDHVDHLRN